MKALELKRFLSKYEDDFLSKADVMMVYSDGERLRCNEEETVGDVELRIFSGDCSELCLLTYEAKLNTKYED